MKRLILTVFFVLLFIAGLYFGLRYSAQQNMRPVGKTFFAFGSFVEIHIRTDRTEDAERVIAEAMEVCGRLDSLFSLYIDDSPLLQINRSENAVLPAEIAELLSVSMKVYDQTGGAFDPAIGALTELWGFEKDSMHLPGKDSITAVMQLSGADKIEVRGDTLIKPLGVHLNFGAIAQGYGADVICRILEREGFDDYLVNSGGEVRQNGDWLVGVRHPRDEHETLYSLNLQNKAAATSGDYERYFVLNGKRFHHILDPKTGYPATGCQSVTVIAKTAAEADALATGVFVLGPKKGLEIIEQNPDAATLIITSDGTELQSKRFNTYIRRK
ncbi:FAD:protein FMN transferase [uncultured bacterium]|nr:FAD:protein FMN transferase [uncultured bacterium]